MILKESYPVVKLKGHPENKVLFRDIKDTDQAFWLEFVNSIKEFGILEPLIVNSETKQIRSGNQRFIAANEIGLETVPVLFVDPETETDEEIRKMIASNTFRRTIGPFEMFGLIGRLRKSTPGSKPPSKADTKATVHKKQDFVSAADIFNAMEPEQRELLKEWFHSQAEDEKKKSEGELIAMIRDLEAEKEALQQEREEVFETSEELDSRVKELEQELSERDERIDELRNVDFDEERAVQDRTINDLLEKQRKLKEKIKELKETPDINLYLTECVTKQREINAVLKQIVDNVDSLNQAKLQEFITALKRTFTIVSKEDKNKGQELIA